MCCTNSTIWSSDSGGGLMTMSRPVISQSIHTSRSVTTRQPTRGTLRTGSYSGCMLRWGGLVARLVVGGVRLWAGVLKGHEAEGRVAGVPGYQLLSPSLADPVGRVLPMVEVVIGAC